MRESREELESMIEATLAGRFFPGETVTSTTAFRVTRNGDIAVHEEDAIDLAGEMEDVLTARRFADTVRLELRHDAPRELARMIRPAIETEKKRRAWEEQQQAQARPKEPVEEPPKTARGKKAPRETTAAPPAAVQDLFALAHIESPPSKA